MEGLLLLLGVGYFVVLPILVFAALNSTRELRRRIERLEARSRHSAPGEAVAPRIAEPLNPVEAAPGDAEDAAPKEDPVEDRPVEPRRPAVASEEPPPLPRARGAVAPVAERAAAPRPGESPEDSVPSSPRTVDWERFLGVRGAAVVGGIALALAGIFFVQVAIERGWLGPAERDTLALVAGLLGLAAHRPLLARGYRALGDSIGGAGSVLVYGAAWAAARLHGLVPVWLALVVMAATTGTALLLATRSSSPVIATFALVGGYATPLLLDTVDGDVAPLFGYVLLLDLALLAVARTRRWTWMLPLAALGTAILQWAWLGSTGGSASPWTTAAVLGGFSALFLGVKARSSDDARTRGLVHLALGVALFAPFALAFDRASTPLLGETIWPYAALVAVLAAGTAIASRRFGSPPDVVWGAVLGTAMLAYALLRLRAAEAGPPDELWTGWAVAAVGLAALHAALTRIGGSRTPAYVSALLSLGAAPIAAIVESTSAVPWPYALCVGALSTLGIWASSCTRRVSFAGAVIGAVAGAGLALHVTAVHRGTLPFDSPVSMGAPALAALGLAAAALHRPSADAARAFAALVVVAPLLALADRAGDAATLVHVALHLLPGVAAAVALQDRRPWTPVAAWLVVGAATVALAAWVVPSSSEGWAGRDRHLVVGAFASLSIAPLGILFLRRTSAAAAEAAAWAAVLPAALLPFDASKVAIEFAGSVSGAHVLLVVGGLLFIAPGAVVDRREPTRAAAAVLLATGLALVSVSLARWAATQWPTVSIALAGAAFAALHGRAGRSTTCALGAATSTAAAAALVALTFVEGAFLREPFYVPLELTIDHALVAASLVVAALGVRALPSDSEARRPFSIAPMVGLLVVLFAWVNAVVLNRFATGERIEVELERMQSRDLSLSLAWAIFGGALLGAGMARRSVGLRWASLVVLLATVVKVFLYDLGALTGLARVGSFLGLALCLLGVSLVYARVLGRRPELDADRGRRPLR